MSRSCDECSACCYTHSVRSLAKDIFTSCGLLCGSGGCSIYEKRPKACRTFRCSWLSEDVGDVHERPDKIGLVPVVSVLIDKRIRVAEVYEGASTQEAGKRFLESLLEAGWYILLYSGNSEEPVKMVPILKAA